jgi:intracellular multiplication protein IcmE
MGAGLIGVSYFTSPEQPQSSVVKAGKINPDPGGLNSDAAQEATRLLHEQIAAAAAEKSKESYTPQLPGSTPVTPLTVEEPGMKPQPDKPVQAAVVAERPPEIHIESVPKPVFTPPETVPEAQPHVQKISSDANDQETRRALLDAFNGWDTRAPRTEVMLTPAEEAAEASGRRTRGSEEGSARPSAAVVPSKVLVPAGRGVYAHTIVAVDSDTGGPIILEADTGPLAGDRLIGAFAKTSGDRLVVHVLKVQHRNQTLDVNGIVTSPETMETSVATSVDEHYLERFVIPFGVAFVEGLGQAVALSNSTISSNAFGGTTQSFGPLNIKQEAEIAAGSGAQAVGNVLASSIPKGPTIRLAANAGVGVMFLTNVEEKK